MHALRFRRQFILVNRTLGNFFEYWRHIPLDRMHLYLHRELEYSCKIEQNLATIILGDIFDAANPLRNNTDILEILHKEETIGNMIRKSFEYGGVFAILAKRGVEWHIFHDSAGLKEIYYMTKASQVVIGSQPKLLGEVFHLEKDNLKQSRDFYNSAEFQRRRYWVGDRTCYVGIRHLKPNHALKIDMELKSYRYFPQDTLEVVHLDEGIVRAAQMLNGFILAAANRRRLALAITAGWDSRVLLAASRGISEQVMYYINRKPGRSLHHQDIQVAQRLAKKLDIPFQIIEYSERVDSELGSIYDKSYTYPRPWVRSFVINSWLKYFPDRYNIVGTTSETAKNYFESDSELTPKRLSELSGYKGFSYVEEVYREWIGLTKDRIVDCGFRPVDFYHWEENLGNFVAKATSESLFGTYPYPPFNCRSLLVTLLGIDLKYRDKHSSRLYREIILFLWKDAMQIPVNPKIKLRIIKALKNLGLYQWYLSWRKIIQRAFC